MHFEVAQTSDEEEWPDFTDQSAKNVPVSFKKIDKCLKWQAV